MSDVGIKISQPGFDVNYAGDINLAFSSSWPNVTVANEINTTSTSAIAHSLTFTPFVIGWNTSSGLTQCVFPNVNATNVIVDTSFPNPLTYGTINLKCFNIDITQDVTYPVVLPPVTTSGSYDKNFGIKVAKNGKNAKSTDLRDFILHSRCQSPQILVVKTGTNPAGDTLSYTSPLGYTSWVFGYVKLGSGPLAGYYVYAPYHAQAYPITKINNVTDTYSITYSAGDIASLVVLRDPMFSATKVSASY